MAAVLLEPGTRLLHIGPHKTGTTAIQGALHLARERLAAEGVVYPGRGRQPLWPILAVTGQPALLGGPGPEISYWDNLVREIRAAGDQRVVLSSEFFAEADHATARRVIADLGGARVHVVVTLRSLTRIRVSGARRRDRGRRRTPGLRRPGQCSRGGPRRLSATTSTRCRVLAEAVLRRRPRPGLGDRRDGGLPRPRPGRTVGQPGRRVRRRGDAPVVGPAQPLGLRARVPTTHSPPAARPPRRPSATPPPPDPDGVRRAAARRGRGGLGTTGHRCGQVAASWPRPTAHENGPPDLSSTVDPSTNVAADWSGRGQSTSGQPASRVLRQVAMSEDKIEQGTYPDAHGEEAVALVGVRLRRGGDRGRGRRRFPDPRVRAARRRADDGADPVPCPSEDRDAAPRRSRMRWGRPVGSTSSDSSTRRNDPPGADPGVRFGCRGTVRLRGQLVDLTSWQDQVLNDDPAVGRRLPRPPRGHRAGQGHRHPAVRRGRRRGVRPAARVLPGRERQGPRPGEYLAPRHRTARPASSRTRSAWPTLEVLAAESDGLSRGRSLR